MAAAKPLVMGSDGFPRVIQSGDAVDDAALPVAAQADQEAGSSTSKLVTPGRQHFHPSACKAWVTFSVSGGVVTIRSQYNVSSITRNAAGNFMVNVTGAFSAQANVCPVACAGLSGSRIWTDLASYSGISTTAVQVITANPAGTLTDPDVCCVHIFGDF